MPLNYRFDATDWYWRKSNGSLFSSKRMEYVADSADAEFAAWGETTGLGLPPTVWPKDDTGAEADAALSDVLAHYGISAAIPPQ